MGMQRHEVPTVFVRGHVEPLDVQYVERALCEALRTMPQVSYSVLSIGVVAPRPFVEIEVGAASGTINERAEGATVRRAGDACVAAFAAHLIASAVAPTTALPA